MNADLLLTGLQQGLILSLIAYAVMIPFRLLNFPDLTSEGAYPVGGAVCAVVMTQGFSPMISIILGTLTAGLLGIATGLIHVRLRVNALLAGIIVSTMAYSLNLRIMGKPNLALFDVPVILNQSTLGNMSRLLVVLLASIVSLALFLQTDLGLRLRAVGLNPDVARRQGINTTCYIVLGLFLAGCFSGLAGCLIVQQQRYMDIGLGVGIAIHGLASLMIGEALIGRKTMNQQLFAPFAGALLYQQIQGLALSIGLAPTDLKLFTGCILLVVIAMHRQEDLC